MVKVVCIQINSGNDVEKNLEKAAFLIKEAANSGAELVFTPENIALMPENSKDLLAKSFYEENNPVLKRFQQLAMKLQVWLLIGSLAIKSDEGKLYNRSYLINDKGQITQHYDKIHLYDVELPNGEKYHESKIYLAGKEPKTADTPLGKLGMTICYDLRFPHLFRQLAKDGADFISVPAAFTKYTGQAHWHVLLCARAIENGCYIFAPAQTGKHPGNKETFGHAMIINPWGEIIAEAGEEEGYITAETDIAKVTEARKILPTLLV